VDSPEPYPSEVDEPEEHEAPGAPALERTRTMLRILLILSVVLPLLFLVGFGWHSHDEAEQQVIEHVDRLRRIGIEHALKVFDVNEQLNARLRELVSDDNDAAVRRRAGPLRERLEEMAAGIPQISSLNIFSVDGRLLVSSRFDPASIDTRIDEREDFVALREGRTSLFVSPVFIGPVLHRPVFTVSSARRNAGGSFGGLVSVAQYPDYFADYYMHLAKEEGSGAAIMLVHADGTLMARYPLPANAVPGMSLQGSLAGRIRGGQLSGTFEDVSRVDGLRRHATFSRIGELPVYLVVSMARSAWTGAWYAQVATVGAFTLVPSAALCAILIFALRGLRREEDNWRQWRSAVAQREAMEAAYRQARRLEALGQLTGSVAHDFNNLLMVVSTSTMLLRRRFAERDDAEQPLGALERSVESGKRLTRQLLAFSRKQPLRPETLDVAQQMRGFIDLVRASLGSRIALSLDIQPGIAPIHADKGEFELAMLNLALNARDAMAEGGKLAVNARNVALDGRSGPPLQGEYVSISFTDSGHGIAQADLRHVFEPFFTTKAPGRGTGLGLSQVHAFCEQAGGMATVESRVGGGTCVTLLLPAALRGAQPARSPAQQANAVGYAGRALLIDDNPEVAQATRVLLEQLGYRVDTVASGDDAIARMMRQVGWDIVVSDVLMPGRNNGIAVARWVQTHQPGVPVLLVTGYTAQLEQARSEGLHVLPKPFDGEGLRKAIEALRKHRLDASGDVTRA
jgi:signal transduction histidine kinase/CheY-like chemotaxis protein